MNKNELSAQALAVPPLRLMLTIAPGKQRSA
ncbi:uncharacterized protein METZ01_LOCUS263606, partial [marine metagenome]